MKTKEYLIQSNHDVYVDVYDRGEGENVNYYEVESKVVARTVKEAIELYFKDTLNFKYDFESASVCCEENDPENMLDYSVLVDIENFEASNYEVERWERGEISLFSNNIRLKIFELIPAKI